jgi:hypothetical protein
VLNGAVAETLVEFLKRFGNFGPDYDQESKDNLSAVKRVLDIIPSFSGTLLAIANFHCDSFFTFCF